MIKTAEVQTTSSSQPAYSLRVIAGLAVVLLFSILAWWISKQVEVLKLPLGIPGKALEYPMWAALVGLVGNWLLKTSKVHAFLRPGIRTELFLKTGLVLMGAGISLTKIITVGGGAVIQTLILVSSVFFFTWWLGGKFGLEDKMRAVMSTALAVCGVSAAIAAAGSVGARKEQVTYVTGLVILVALPMMVIVPLLASAMGLSQTVAGAWFGGNIDTTAAVVGAGTIYGAQAQETASIVKATQNTLIGLVAFLLAVYVAAKDPATRGKVSPRVIWDRFPKFVLGFLLASILFTLGIINGDKGTAVDALKSWAFTLAFVSMGLDLSLSEFKTMGWKPVAVFLLATVFNTLLALLVAWTLFR